MLLIFLRCFLSILFFLQGRVVTETTTEYKEATDDSGFSDLVGSSNFPQISSNSSFGDAVVQSKPSAESSESSSDEEEDNEDKFQDEALKAHNDYRAKHGVELLKLDKKVSNSVFNTSNMKQDVMVYIFQLCSYAKDWAAKLAKTDSFEHRQNQELGENLFCSWSSNAKAKCPGNKPVDSWYSEIKKYEFGKEPTSMGTGNQIITYKMFNF